MHFLFLILIKLAFFIKKFLVVQKEDQILNWVDFNFFGHPLVFHLDTNNAIQNIKNNVDGHGVPVPHFGVILEWKNWKNISVKLKSYNIQLNLMLMN